MVVLEGDLFMKGIVLYYSATGNTRKIAKAIHQGVKQSLKDSDIATIKEVAPRDLVKYDLIGLGAPLWGSRAPANVHNYLRKLPNLKGKLAFPFCNHGSYPDGFMYWVVPQLQKKGLTIIGWNDWYGGGHQLPYIMTVHPCDGHPDEIDLKEAEAFGREMAERAQRIAAGETSLIPELPKPEDDMLWRPRELRMGGGPPDMDARKMALKEMKINMEKCTYPECTLCLQVCPMDSLDFSVSPPVRKKNCLGCFTCEGICPQGAVEVDWERFFSVGETEQARTSHEDHPFFKALKEAAATGRFRWLIPIEKAYSKTPVSKLRQHPRYTLD
jgi:NAD-dependent dihydropyrimidine dehydrogenase PreA subunit/flavodoxin